MELELKDVYYGLTILVILLGGVSWVRDAISNMRGDLNLARLELQNHKENHAKLEGRVEAHEEKIDERLIGMGKKIDLNHKETTDSLNSIQLSIEKLKPR